MNETPCTWTLSGAKWYGPIVIEGPRLDKETKVVIEKAPVDAEIEQLTDALERHKRLVARYRKPMPEGGLTSSEKLHTSHVARVDAEARAEQAEAERERMLDLLEHVRDTFVNRTPDGPWPEITLREIEAVLREHDRLQGGEDG